MREVRPRWVTPRRVGFWGPFAPDTLKSVRDRAILATLLYYGIRREELCLLRLRDLQSRQGLMHFRIKGKRDKIRFIPVHPMALRLIGEIS